MHEGKVYIQIAWCNSSFFPIDTYIYTYKLQQDNKVPENIDSRRGR